VAARSAMLAFEAPAGGRQVAESQEEEPRRLVVDNAFSKNFGHPSVFVDPRRAMIGVRLHFPR
jgi:hypothetical protein